MQAAWLKMVRHVMANTEDVGERFAEEARKIHYGETEERGIRGQASRAETEALAGLSARTGASLVLGVIERAGNTLYCTALYFEPDAGLVAKHRKLMPTGTERLIWGKGDGSTLPVTSRRSAGSSCGSTPG